MTLSSHGLITNESAIAISPANFTQTLPQSVHNGSSILSQREKPESHLLVDLR